MKIIKILLAVLLLGALAIPWLGCSSEPDEEELAENQVVTVQRGNLTVDITAAGNLALSLTEDLAFEIAGTVEEVLVEEGDIVEEGQVLANLDTSEWEDNLESLEDAVTAKERDLLQAQVNLKTAELNLKNSNDNKATKELALLNAQISLRNLEKQLDETRDVYTWPDIEIAQIALDNAKTYYEYVSDDGLASSVINYAKARVTAAEATLNALINSYDTEEVAIAKMQVEASEKSLAQAQEDLDDVAEDVILKELQLALSHAKLGDAQKAIEDAEEALAEAKSESPVITAPFDGFVTLVNVEGGDEILKGTVAVVIADPEKFKADILVSEMDILQVKLGGEAWVQVDAMQGLSLPAKVTHISPTATIQSGVVNYMVKVEVESLQAIQQQRQEAMQETAEDVQQGEMPERLKQAIEAGQITREQAEEMIGQMQQGQRQQSMGPQGQLPSMISENFQLREGLSVTVNVILEERNDVLLVPNVAVNSRNGQSYVQVMTAAGTPEDRTVQTGISNWQYTEITDGLSEGEQVLVPQGTGIAATAGQVQSGARGVRMPFMGPH